MDNDKFFRRNLSSFLKRTRDRKADRTREGAAAVEFAFVGLPFFMLIFAIFELAIALSVNSMLDNAVSSSARLVRTGQAADMDQDDFVAAICSQMVVMANSCPDRLSIDVRPVVSFSPIAPPAIVDGEFDDSATGFNAGGARNLMVVRAWYQHPLVTPFMQQALSRLDNGAYLMQSTSAFRNEPY